MYKTIGILAHVDAGKTTFSEQLLFQTKSIKEYGRVDHQTSHLDVHQIEQQRGITIFSEQATFSYNDSQYTIIDTPGHVDFSAEMERSLLALDAAILLIDSTRGLQGHTLTIWHILQKQRIPTVLFVNKIDQIGADIQRNVQEIHEQMNANALLYSEDTKERIEHFATIDERYVEAFIEDDWSDEQWQQAMVNEFMEANYFPIFSGAALKGEGVAQCLAGLDTLLKPQLDNDTLQAVVYKMRHDEQQQKIVFLKIKQGVLRLRDTITIQNDVYKVTQMRLYNGTTYKELQSAVAGQTIGVIGLKTLEIGMILNGDCAEKSNYIRNLVPTMRSKVMTTSNIHPKEMLAHFRLLEAEDPSLEVEWSDSLQQIHIKIMGEIQLEVLTQLVEQRFGEHITFEQPTIIYKETIRGQAMGYGHYEPLKHYAEVHLFIEEGERGTGIVTTNECHANDLNRGHQNTILKIARASDHASILTGSALTDVRITLKTGRAHIEHTEGGDFQEATKRAIRQALEQAEIVLLEPYYSFSMTAHIEKLGKMMTDIQKLFGHVNTPVTTNDLVTITGTVPVANFQNYPATFASYTNGRGNLQLQVAGYDICHNTEEVIEKIAYNKDTDSLYTSNSIFCKKGKGYAVPWQEAKSMMHIPINE